MRSDDTGAWFERRLREPLFVIPEITDFRRQRGTAREREGAFGNAVITVEVRYSLLTKHYRRGRPAAFGRRRRSGPVSDTEELPLVHESHPGTVGADAPAVVLVHGRGTDERDLLPLGAQLPKELHVLSVRVPQSMGPDSYTWYDLDLSAGGLHASQPDPEEFRRSLDAVHEFVDGAVNAYDIDPDRVGLLGFILPAVTT